MTKTRRENEQAGVGYYRKETTSTSCARPRTMMALMMPGWTGRGQRKAWRCGSMTGPGPGRACNATTTWIQAKAAVAAGHDDAMMTGYYSSTRQTEVWFGQARVHVHTGRSSIHLAGFLRSLV